MNRATLERITASLVVVLITVFAVGLILIIANTFFAWDLFTPYVEKILYFLGLSVLVVIAAATIINIMLNLSRLTFFVQKIAERYYEKSSK